MSSSASTLAGAGGGASAGGPGPSGARAGDDDYPQDQVKVYSHEGDGENTEHLISMDLHDVKTEMAKDAENAETPKNAANASSSTVQTPTTTAALAGLRPLIQHPTMVYANGTFMMPPFPAGTPIYPVMRPVKMEAGSDWKVSQGQISIPAYSYPAGFLPTMEHGSLRPATAYPFMIPGPYVAAATPYQHQLTTLGQPVAPNATVSPHSGMVAPQVKEKKQHIKKPLNAFMLFMKEKRADVIKECTLKESAAINQILGKMWHALDRSEQAKYYEMAREERAKHMQMYPGWSARDNYAVHKKRRKRKTKTVDGSKQSPTATIAGGASTTDDQDSHNTSNDNNDIDDPNARKCRARFGLDQQHLWCNPCKRKKKCTKFSEDEDDSAPKAYHGELEDDVISNDTKNSGSVVGDKVPLRSGGVADAMTTKTTVQSETSSHGNGQMDRSVSQSEQRVMHAPITLQTIPST